MVDRLTARLGPEIDDIEDRLDVLEARTIEGSSEVDRRDLAVIRRKALELHRYFHPQREAMHAFRHGASVRLPRLDVMEAVETTDRVTHLVEDLETARSRAQIIEDGIAIRFADQMNRNMYRLSVVATVFLPLGFVTGLLGVNVVGIPGSENPEAFFFLCGLLVALTALEIWILMAWRII